MAADKQNTGKRFSLSAVIRGLAHLPNFFKLFFRLLFDPRVPFAAKIIPAAAFIYLVSPVDLIPDLPLPLGYVEDAVIVYFAFRFLFRAAPREVVREHVAMIERGF